MSFLEYKRNEKALQEKFARFNMAVRIEPIDAADVYYTDGDAKYSFCKLIFTAGPTVYLPQLIYNVSPEYKKIIREWMKENYFTGLNSDN